MAWTSPARLALCWNQIVPATSRQVATLPVDADQIGCDRVQPAEIVQEPGVEIVGPKRRLHRRDVERNLGARQHPHLPGGHVGPV